MDKNPGVLKSLARRPAASAFCRVRRASCCRRASGSRARSAAATRIGYVPPDRDGAFHRVRVEVDRRPTDGSTSARGPATSPPARGRHSHDPTSCASVARTRLLGIGVALGAVVRGRPRRGAVSRPDPMPPPHADRHPDGACRATPATAAAGTRFHRRRAGTWLGRLEAPSVKLADDRARRQRRRDAEPRIRAHRRHAVARTSPATSASPATATRCSAPLRHIHVGDPMKLTTADRAVPLSRSARR